MKHLKINGFKKIVQLRRGVCVCVCGGEGGDLYFNVACSVGVFFERALCSRHVETSRREEEEMGPVLASTVRVTISTLPNLPLP